MILSIALSGSPSTTVLERIMRQLLATREFSVNAEKKKSAGGWTNLSEILQQTDQ